MKPNLHLNELPASPGIYMFRDAAGTLLYIGKAINLQRRVKSYFLRTGDLESSKQMMVHRIVKIEFTIVNNELEALLLEATLIQRHQPIYNVMLRDDKSFSYIKITTRDPFPVITRTRRVTRDGSRYFGPYTSSWAVRETLIALKAFFPYPSCTLSRSEICLEVQHGFSLGPVHGPADPKEYRQAVDRVIAFLSGRSIGFLEELKAQMNAASASQAFEHAALLRDRIHHLHRMVEKQVVVSPRGEHQDIFSLALGAKLGAVNTFIVRNGKLLHKMNLLLQHIDGKSKEEILTACLEQYYSRAVDLPKEILVPTMPLSAASLETLTHSRISVPVRGRRRKLIKMGEKNAQEFLQQQLTTWEREEVKAEQALAGLAEVLKLPQPPQRIEGYDISNIQGVEAVGSMVVVEAGRPAPKQYRKFKIEREGRPDDFAMMEEMLTRRFRRAAPPQSEKRRESWPMPDLVVVDGGKGQLGVAEKVFARLHLAIPLISLAKREEEIFMPGRATSIRLPMESPILHLLQRLRDEAHRFAITYHRQRRSRASLRSSVDEVKGIGPATRKKLIQTFGSLRAARQAPLENIETAIGRSKAAQFFSPHSLTKIDGEVYDRGGL